MSDTATAAGARLDIGSSRWWALFTMKVTKFIFPDRLATDERSIFARKIRFWLTPWARDENHMLISHVAEIEHDRGLVWDGLSIESTGGLSPIVIRGLRKRAANAFVARVRAAMQARR